MLIFILTSCNKNNSENNTSSSVVSDTSIEEKLTERNADNNNQTSSAEASKWGPVQLHSGWINGLYIQDNIGIISVGYDTGGSGPGTTYVYALDILDGKIIGEVSIPGEGGPFDICERYAFIWVKDGINVYDLKKDFKFVKTLTDRWTSNFGNYFFVEDAQEAAYIIDKRTLKKVELKVTNDDEIYRLLPILKKTGLPWDIRA